MNLLLAITGFVYAQVGLFSSSACSR